MTVLPADFYERCLEHHRDVLSGPDALAGVVAGSLPIPFFGDVEGYLSSEIRVVTVGLNPSDKEFPPAGKRQRFDLETGLTSALGLEETLSAYFRNNPYNGWFYSFETVLAGVGASYYPKGSPFRKAADDVRNVALHLDVCSPIATSPTWSDPELPHVTRANLTTQGNRIFAHLVDLLRPDIVIASVAAHHMLPFHPAFGTREGWREIVRHDDTMNGTPLPAPLVVRTFVDHPVSPKASRLIALGSAANIPFGRFSTPRKKAAGRAILAEWRSATDRTRQTFAG